MRKSYMIMDMQFGSTGKGSLAGYLAIQNAPDTLVTAWGPNAGHTYIGTSGRKFIHRMLANGIVSPNLKQILIGPGSVIDAACFLRECIGCEYMLRGVKIVVHPNAAVVLPEHLETEKANVTIGSTMKGTGAAVVHRIRRDVKGSNIASKRFPVEISMELRAMGIDFWISQKKYDEAIDKADVMQIEGAQGYSLSIYHGLYPYTTSRDVTPAQVLADCGIPYSIKPEVYGTLRTYPIRVANRYNDLKEMIGFSGPGYSDQKEIDWKDIGIEPELTTVTKLPRRVFGFSMEQVTAAARQCGPTKLFLNFANYMKIDDFLELLVDIEVQTGVTVEWVGVGPAHNDIVSPGQTDWHHMLDGEKT